MQRIEKLSTLLPADLVGAHDVHIRIPQWAFIPDRWTAAFLRGLVLLAPEWKSKRVWEVGVGTGVNLILLNDAPCREYYFSDFDPRCTQLALENVSSNGLDLIRYRALTGPWDLVTPPNGAWVPNVDVVFACIPQVPADFDLTQGDNIAHYYCPRRYPNSRLHACGLGLNEELLKQARRVLSSRGSVVLNLGGRPGIERLKEMYVTCGYVPRVAHEEIIPQHHETSLESLAVLEENGHTQFEFFEDEAARMRINARTAEERRKRELPLFHKIYVIEGVLA